MVRVQTLQLRLVSARCMQQSLDCRILVMAALSDSALVAGADTKIT